MEKISRCGYRQFDVGGVHHLKKMKYTFPARKGGGRGDFPQVNQFMVNTLWLSGGGDRRGLGYHLGHYRCGGSRGDMLLGLKNFDRMPSNGAVTLTPAQIVERLKLPTGLSPLSVREAWPRAPFKRDANPGPLLTSLGYLKKGNCEALIREIALTAEQKLVSGQGFPPIHFGMAGRPGLCDVRKINSRLSENLPFGRLIWVADGWEPVISQKFLLPLMGVFRKNHPHIKIGFNKFNRDYVGEDGSRLWGYEWYINLDYSKFDASLPASVIGKVKSVLNYMFDGKEGFVLDWLFDNLVNSRIVLPDGTVFQKHHGVPSGTGLTAVVDSLANAIMLLQFMEECPPDCMPSDWHAEFQGDDNRLALSWPRSNESSRRFLAARFLTQLSKFVKLRYGMEIHPGKCASGPFLEIGYIQPILPHFIRDGSRRVMNEWWKQEETRLGRPLRFEEKWQVLGREPDGPAGGNTHRWSYHYRDRVGFLCYYMKPNLRELVRPTREVITRLVNPESSPRNINDHIMSLVCCLIDNFDSAHCRNRIFFLMRDAMDMKLRGISLPSMARADTYLRVSEHRGFGYGPLDETSLCNRRQHSPRDLRQWFRRQQAVVDLRTVPREGPFLQLWERLLNKCSQIRERWGTLGLDSWMIRDEVRRANRGPRMAYARVEGLNEMLSEIERIRDDCHCMPGGTEYLLRDETALDLTRCLERALSAIHRLEFSEGRRDSGPFPQDIITWEVPRILRSVYRDSCLRIWTNYKVGRVLQRNQTTV